LLWGCLWTQSRRRVDAAALVRHGFGPEKRIGLDFESHRQLGTAFSHDVDVVDARRHPRFKLEVDVQVYPRNASVVRGHTVDISESGISAMLRQDVPIGEVVRLAFSLPLGEVELHAMVRQRNAFRYGLQFVESSTSQEVIGRTCRQLAMEESLRMAKLP
jgi:c-di-GMP-binding flagellar brake protein YcgR